MAVSRYFRVAVALTGLLGAANVARAETQWDKDHPHREEVNSRLAKQNARLKTERKEGEITGARAKTLHKEDHTIRTEERGMAARDGGHITGTEQKALNQQENQVSRQIGK